MASGDQLAQMLAEAEAQEAGERSATIGGASRRKSMVDDDMSDDDDGPLAVIAAKVQAQAPLKSAQIATPTPTLPPQQPQAAKKRPADAPEAPKLAAQVASCKSKIAELEAVKEGQLKQEDYMGAHQTKQIIQKQEQDLQALRRQLDSMATPARKGPRVSVACAGKKIAAPKAAPAPAPAPIATPGAPAPGTSPAAPTTSPAAPAATPPAPSAPVDVAEAERAPAEAAQEAPPKEAEAITHQSSEDGEEAQDEGDEDMETGQWRPSKARPDFVELPAEGDTAGAEPFALPTATFDKLYPYQRAGVAWMARLWQKRQGGVLADEMGLGKTVQVCSLLNGARRAGATHALLLLPVTLLDQWAKEARIWCPGWPVYTYYGTAAQRAQALRRVSRPEGGLLLTSYALIGNVDDLFKVIVDDAPSPRKKGRQIGVRQPKRRKLDDDDGLEEESDNDEPQEIELPDGGELPRSGDVRPWDIVICDEAHRMKSINTLLGKSLRQLQSSCRLLLTGTPVQNALQDLWSLMDFAQPGLLGNHATFVKTFSEPIDRGSVRGANPFAVQLKKHLSEQLRSLISPHLLRRTKLGAGLVSADGEEGADGPSADGDEEVEAADDVRKLVPKKETIIWLAPSEEQIQAYQRILEQSEVIREACKKQKLGIEVFRAIGLLKRLCNHPMLLLPTPKQGAWSGMLSEVAAAQPAGSETEAAEGLAVVPSEIEGSETLAGAGATAGEADDARAGRSVEALLKRLPRHAASVLSQSSKLRCLNSLLPALASKGHRTLIFCQSLKMLDLIQVCCLKPHGLRCLRIDGQTDALSRAEKVGKFNRQPDRFQCMLLTTSVGGVGLNLTSADRVILVDPAWNPATDAQAVDRAFRIGQTREVRVYRLIMSGLIEDKMFRLQVFKMGLTRSALEADQQHRYFSSREIKALFEWTEPSEGETRKLMLEKHGEDAEEAVRQAAEEDGGGEGWMQAGPAVGISDFTLLHASMATEEKDGDVCTAQVMEAQQKLGAADEKLKRMTDAKQEAEEHRVKVAKELEDAKANSERLKESRTSAIELLKERRAELARAQKADSLAQQKLEKAAKAREKALSEHTLAQQVRGGASGSEAEAARTASLSASTAQDSEQAIVMAVEEAEAQIALFDGSGAATSQGVADANVVKMRMVQKRIEKMRVALEAQTCRQKELEAAEEALGNAERAVAEAEAATARFGENVDGQAAIEKKSAEITHRNREVERRRFEQDLTRAHQKAESAREGVAQAAQAVQECSQAFIDSFDKTKSRPVRADQVKAAQVTARAVFRQLIAACSSARKAREAWSKALAARRKAAQKVGAAGVAEAVADFRHTEASRDFDEASAEEQVRRKEREFCEAELASSEESKANIEAEEAANKRRLEELKASQPVAKEAVAAAKQALKEAVAEKQALHSACSKVEKAQMQMEEAANSAIQTLKGEQYDATQVERAYERQNGSE